MNSTSKAQIKQVFTFILFITVVGFLVILGYQAVSGMLASQCTSQRTQFVNDIQSYLDSYDDYGSIHKETIALPCNYRKLCFANASVASTPGSEQSDTDVQFTTDATNKYKVLNTANAGENNIFLVGEFAEPAGYSNKTVLAQSYQCFNGTGGTVSLTFKGQGQKTLVTQ